ncbi:MAG: DUF3108 domain-containing protein [Proteobacteria bacterium]|nr:DUF3108 domain-containing protein [Pseudomonadota bacterium]MBU1582998.1 DUF3108 domain-containing protein [Pseudomonadota bacterium]MBU2453444.1 DUF3108 domain-containing protein [Pseudomonadota bacterium]MBU2631451.1 DUF3108 domain-containing protein [Pseudomonadota bacterium]
MFFSSPLGHAGPKGVPFSIGEEINYTVSWETIKAGTANFKVLEFTTVHGKKAYQFILEVKSNRYIDMLYKIRDRLEAVTDIEVTHSLLYKKTQSGKAKRQVMVEFDWEAQTAVYSNFGGKRDPIKIPLETVDPLSAFYKMRTLNFEAGNDLSFPVTDGKKQFIQEASVINKEKITLPSGTYDTYVLVPQVNHFSGVFTKSKDPTVKLWVTADDRKIPVRIKVKVFIGSVIFDFVSVK